MSPRAYAAMRARELRRREEARQYAKAVVVWTLATAGTLWASYGFAKWVIW
jgi:hypothetical protein